jgi:O-antigen ligase
MIRNILISLSLLGLIGGQIVRLQLGNGVSITMLDTMVAVLAVVTVGEFAYKQRFKQLFHYSLSKPFMLFLSIAGLSLLVHLTRYSPIQLVIASLYLFRFISYLLLFVLLLQLSDNNKQRFRQYLLVAGGVILLFGFLQYLLYPYLGNLYYLGWDDHLYRLFSVFLDPNFAGCFFVLFFLFVTANLLQQKNSNTFYLLGALALLSVLAVILTFSRSAFLVLLIGSVVFFSAFVPKKILLVGLFGLCLTFFLFADFTIEGKNPLRIVSSSERVRSMAVALQIFQKEPLLGVGFNAYRYAQNRYGFRTSDKWMSSHADAGTDNSFLFVLATTGIVGMVAFSYVVLNIFQRALRIPNTLYRRYVISAVVVLGVDSFFVNALFYPMLLYWLFMSVAMFTEQEKP